MRFGGGPGPPTVRSVLLLSESALINWVLPAAVTELLGMTRHRLRLDLTNETAVRLLVNVGAAGLGGSKLRLQYSTDQAGWSALGPEIDAGSSGLQESGWVALPAGARSDVYVRAVGLDGNGIALLGLGLVAVQSR